MKAILRNRTLIILGTAESISGIGDWITMMAVLAMLVFRGGGGVVESSGVFLAGLLPTLFSSPAAGWLVDRINRKTLMIISQLLAGVIVSGLFFSSRVELIYLVLGLEAIVISIMAPARQAVIPTLVHRDDLTRVNAFLQQLAGLVKVFAPVIAGLVLSVMEPQMAILFDVASFFLAAGILCMLPSLPANPMEYQKVTDTTAPNSIKSVLRSIPQLQILFFAVFVAILSIIGFDVISSVYFRDVLQQGEKAFGFAIGLVGIGSLIATMFLMLRRKKTNPWKDIMFGYAFLAMIPLSLVIASFIPDINTARIVVLLACLVGGIGNGFVHVQIGTLMQLLTPSTILGQVGGWMQSVMVAGQIIGLVLTPILVPGLVSMPVYFAGTLVIMAGLFILLMVQIYGKARIDPDDSLPVSHFHY
jgi:MFS family permease